MPPKSLSGQYAYARGGKVVGYNSRRSEAHDGGWVWFTKDERDRYKKASDAQKTAIIKTATKRARGNPDANVPFGRVDTTGIVGDPHAASRKTAISRAKKNLGKDDGDALPSGFYEQDTEDIDGDGDTEEIKRTGKTKSLDLYHGSSQKPGGAVGEFILIPGNYKGEEREAINRRPSLFLTPDRSLATYHAQRGELDPESGLTDSQLYSVTVIPSEIADLGDCTDDKTAKKMADAGVDVINCPEYPYNRACDRWPSDLLELCDSRQNLQRSPRAATGLIVWRPDHSESGRTERRRLWSWKSSKARALLTTAS